MSKQKTITEFKRGSILYVRIPKVLLHFMDAEIRRLKPQGFKSRSGYVTALLGLAKENLERKAKKKK